MVSGFGQVHPIKNAPVLTCNDLCYNFACAFCFIALLDGTSNGSDSKKLRVEERVGEAPPSRVLHIRKLPSEVSETEIIALGLPFGKVTNILTLKGKNQVRVFFF